MKQIQVVLLLLSVLYSCACLYYALMLSRRVGSLERRLLIAKVTAQGRSKADVVRWLGKPDRTFRITAPHHPADSVLVYKSNPRRLQGCDDVWVVVDSEERVVTVYWPDLAQDRPAVEALFR